MYHSYKKGDKVGFLIFFNNYLENVIAPLIILLGISMLTLLGVYGNPFSIDFSIIFDGAYKITQGFVPFVDFSVPPIPVSLYIPAFFQIIFGSNLFAMALVTITLSSILSLIFYKTLKGYFSSIIRIVMAILFYMCFAGILAYPWYNQIAFFFFLLNFFLIFLVAGKEKITNDVLFMSSILTILSIFSKIEVGVIQFFLLSAYFICAYRKKLISIIKFFIIPTLFISGIIIGLISSISSPVYFVFGIQTFFERIGHLFNIFILEKMIFSFSFYLILIILALLFISRRNVLNNPTNEKNRLIMLLFMLNILIFSVSFLSGLTIQTRVLALPLNLFIVYLIFFKGISWKEKIIKLDISLLKIILVLFSIFFILSSLNFFVSPEISDFKNPLRQTEYLFSYSSDYFKTEDGCYKGAVFSKEIYEEAFRKVTKTIEENKDKTKILYMDDYFKFIKCDYNLSSPKGFPLWFHEGETFQRKDLEYVLKIINDEKFEVIIVNFMSVYPDTEIFFEESLVKQRYNKTETIGFSDRFSNTLSIYHLKQG